MSSSKPKTAETILREALRDIVNEVCTRPSCGSVQREAIYGTANNALAEADNASPWIKITPETMPEDHAMCELCDSVGWRIFATRHTGTWWSEGTKVHKMDYEQKVHYRLIELPPLPGSETE